MDQKRPFTGFLSRFTLSDDEKGPLGLTTLHRPVAGSVAVADIIFIHGLGGGSRKTWSYSREEHHYWPSSWLPSDPDFENVRIHVFGYNADWTERQQSALNINDFAHSLLAELKNSPDIRRDATMIVLVGHSMGGCVAKKAYILARQDPTCKELVERVHSMFFLGTPHRGSDLALVLEKMLTVAWGRKPFVKDLLPNSNTLAEINDTFRHYALDLKLWSFYETQPVRMKLMNKIVVEKLSSTLGYPNEEIAAMNADHRHVCKFENTMDPNYRLLRNALHTTVDVIKSLAPAQNPGPSQVPQTTELSTAESSARILSFFGLEHALEDDIADLQILKEPGSCEWFTEGISYVSWANKTGSHILWLTGRPATGKSVLSSHVFENLKQSGSYLSYFLFKHGKSGKSTLSDCFRSLAYQMSQQDSFIREKLLNLANVTTSWDRSDETSIWRKIFTGILFLSPSLPQHIWVIDGVDECSDFNTFFTKKLLATVPTTLRLFGTSRELEEIGRGLASLGSRVNVHALSEQDTFDDMRLFLSTKLAQLDRLETAEELDNMCDKILQKSQGSFLWVRLVLQDFETTWTEEAMEMVLQDVPSDLGDMYHRILLTIEADPHKKVLAKSILTWVVLASRPLSTDELRCAIKLDVGQTMQNMNKAIPSLCGQLVFIDQSNKVQIIHETAREFLLGRALKSDLAISKAFAHTRLSIVLIRYLAGDAMKVQSSTEAPKRRPRGFASSRSTKPTGPDVGLVDYAALFVSYHIYRCTPEDDLLIEEICTFLQSQNILSWIEHSARGGDLSPLTRAATNLRGYLCRRAKHVSPTDPQINMVDGWVVDLIRVAAKFRAQLLACPSSIHCLIPPLCPPESNISMTFAGDVRSASFVVRGLPAGSWDDCLIRMDFTKGQATAMAHGEQAFAVGFSNGLVNLYSPVSLQSLREFSQPGRIRLLEFSPGGDHLLSCSAKNLSVWDVKTGASTFSSSLQSAPLSSVFLSDSELLTASATSQLTKWNFLTGVHETISWLEIDDYDMPASGIPYQSPSKVAFSNALPEYDAVFAVGYRNHAVVIWDATELQVLGECNTVSANGVDDIVFNPNCEIPALVVAQADGILSVFDYRTQKLDSTRPSVYASSMACSKDGRGLVCGTGRGTIHVYEFDQGQDGNIVLTPIYRIGGAVEYAISGVAFHFEGARFVDISRRQCRVWEPAALVRRDSEVESTSDVVSLPQRAIGTSTAPQGPLITSPLAAPKDGRFIIGGNSNGEVILFSTTDGKELGTAYRHARGASVTLVMVAESGGLVASTDDSGRVIVAEVPQNLPVYDTLAQDLASRTVLDQRLGTVVSQLLFSPGTERLLILSVNTIELWEPSQARRAGKSKIAEANAYVLQHPSRPTAFLVMAGDTCRIFDWQDCTELTLADGIQLLQRSHLDSISPAGPAFGLPILGIGTLECRKSNDSSTSRWTLWPVAAFDKESDSCGKAAPNDTLDRLGATIHSVLGVIRGTTIVFLDTTLWICTFDLKVPSVARIGGPSRSRSPDPLSVRTATPDAEKSASPTIRRHFFAMGEWRDGRNKHNALMVTASSGSTRGGGYQFAFAAGHRVVLAQGGLDFSEMVSLSDNTLTTRSEHGTEAMERWPHAKMSPAPQWTVLAGSMHRRSSNW